MNDFKNNLIVSKTKALRARHRRHNPKGRDHLVGVGVSHGAHVGCRRVVAVVTDAAVPSRLEPLRPESCRNEEE